MPKKNPSSKNSKRSPNRQVNTVKLSGDVNRQIPLSILPSPSWTWDMGISYSLLSRFIACRDRFHKYAVQGMREVGKQQKALNFGTYFHKLIELSVKHRTTDANRIIAMATKSKSTIAKISTLDRLIGNMVFQEYCEYYSDIRYDYFDTETQFDVKYHLAGVGPVRLVGKIDQIIRWPDRSFYVQENKTKENINEELLTMTIPHNLQTMMYAICAGLHYKKPINGVVYNVIRKSKHRQRKTETELEFVERVRSEIKLNPKYFFLRWEYPLNQRSFDDFKLKTFDPNLREFYLWWKSIESNPLDPWVDNEGRLNSRHYRRPFGVYDSLTNGEGDFFNVITRNSYANVTLNNPPFSELAEDEEN